MNRPAQLPMSATFVVWASVSERGGLTPAEKMLWYHTWTMDRSVEDGCYMSHASLGHRLGFRERTIEQLRYRLRKLGLLVSFERSGGRSVGWAPTLPDFCRPTSARAAGAEAVELAARLDDHLASLDPTRLPDGKPPGNGHCKPEATAIAKPRQQPLQTRRSARAAALEGGQGGGAVTPTSPVVSEAQLPPAVEEGEVAKATRARKESRTAKDRDAKGLILPLLTAENGGLPSEPSTRSEWEEAKESARRAYRCGGHGAA